MLKQIKTLNVFSYKYSCIFLNKYNHFLKHKCTYRVFSLLYWKLTACLTNFLTFEWKLFITAFFIGFDLKNKTNKKSFILSLRFDKKSIHVLVIHMFNSCLTHKQGISSPETWHTLTLTLKQSDLRRKNKFWWMPDIIFYNSVYCVRRFKKKLYEICHTYFVHQPYWH